MFVSVPRFLCVLVAGAALTIAPVAAAAAETTSSKQRGASRDDPNFPLKAKANPGSLVQCYSHVFRCIVPVYVHALANGACSAWVDPEKIRVPKVTPDDTAKFGHTAIRVVWVLRKGDKNTRLPEFSFDSNSGVKPRNPPQMLGHFESEGLDGDYGENPNPEDGTTPSQRNKRFRWVSKHSGVEQEVAYDLEIFRRTGSSMVPIIQKCDAADPTISNSN